MTTLSRLLFRRLANRATRNGMTALSILRLPAIRRLGQGEENDLFAGHGADVMVHGQHLDTRGLLDHCLHDRPRRFDQMSPKLLEQIAPLLARERLGQMLFGRSQNAPETDHEEVTDQMGTDVLGPSADVFPDALD